MAPKDSKKSKSHLILDLYLSQDLFFFPALAQEITGLSRLQCPNSKHLLTYPQAASPASLRRKQMLLPKQLSKV
jgi:hypothetical protein